MRRRPDLPDKLYFKIGEVARLTGVKQHVLRYWESEFSEVRPQKSRSNQRLYRRKDLEAVLAIKHLLYDRKFTIEGARRHLREAGVDSSVPDPDPDAIAAAARDEAIAEMRDEVERARAETADRFHAALLELRREAAGLLDELAELEAAEDDD